jgi:hypothetical protein
LVETSPFTNIPCWKMGEKAEEEGGKGKRRKKGRGEEDSF